MRMGRDSVKREGGGGGGRGLTSTVFGNNASFLPRRLKHVTKEVTTMSPRFS
jgi:hypothetical protein